MRHWILRMHYRAENGHTVWWLFIKYDLEEERAGRHSRMARKIGARP